MKTVTARKIAALVFALFVAGGSLASAGGAVNFGSCKGVTVNAGPADYGM
ncbi:MAG: hypothetical protein AB1511_03895 [Deinococcota bacterium]